MENKDLQTNENDDLEIDRHWNPNASFPDESLFSPDLEKLDASSLKKDELSDALAVEQTIQEELPKEEKDDSIKDNLESSLDHTPKEEKKSILDNTLVAEKKSIIQEIVNNEAQNENLKKANQKSPKKSVFGLLFRVVSIVFILGCCVFYGARLIKYYKIYNPKVVNIEHLLASDIVKSSPIVYENDGLYRLNGNYIYKGENVNNYLLFNNFLWRIIQVNADNSIDLLLDEPINYLAYNETVDNFKNSNIYAYLNEVFLPVLNQDKLQKASLCLDKKEDLQKTTCENLDTNFFVRLLNINQFLNSRSEESTYVEKDSSLWLTDYKSDAIWITNGNNVSSANPDEFYAVKPVITLKSTTQRLGGDGSKENPYLIEEESTLQVGDYVQLDEDKWIIYEIDKEKDTLKLVSDELLPLVYPYSTTSSTFDPTLDDTLAGYLNNRYLEELSYKDKLVKTNWYIGSYKADYKTIYDNSTESYVGLYNVADLKFNTHLSDYTLLTPMDEQTIYMIQDGNLTASLITLGRRIRPSIAIWNKPIQSGVGSYEDPYILED